MLTPGKARSVHQPIQSCSYVFFTTSQSDKFHVSGLSFTLAIKFETPLQKDQITCMHNLGNAFAALHHQDTAIIRRLVVIILEY